MNASFIINVPSIDINHNNPLPQKGVEKTSCAVPSLPWYPEGCETLQGFRGLGESRVILGELLGVLLGRTYGYGVPFPILVPKVR